MEMETRIFFSPQITQISADEEKNKIITPCKSALIRVSSIHRRLHRFSQMENNKIITPRKSAFQAYTADYTDFRR